MRIRRPPKQTATPSAGEDDHRLFLDAIGPVRPLVSAQVAETSTARPPPEPRQSQLDEARVPGELIAAVPSRDMLAVTGSQVPGGIAALAIGLGVFFGTQSNTTSQGTLVITID